MVLDGSHCRSSSVDDGLPQPRPQASPHHPPQKVPYPPRLNSHRVENSGGGGDSKAPSTTKRNSGVMQATLPKTCFLHPIHPWSNQSRVAPESEEKRLAHARVLYSSRPLSNGLAIALILLNSPPKPPTNASSGLGRGLWPLFQPSSSL